MEHGGSLFYTVESDLVTVNEDWLASTAWGLTHAEVIAHINGTWVSLDLKTPITLKKGTPVVILQGQGLDLGVGSALMMTAHSTGPSDDPPITKRAVDAFKASGISPVPPADIYYRVRVMNPQNHQFADYVMLVDTGSSRSGAPGAYTRIGIEAIGSETTYFHTGSMKVKCGLAQLTLLSRAYPDGMDDIGNPKFRYENLPAALKDKLTRLPNPICIVKLQGSVPILGLNTLRDWQVYVDPVIGLV